MELGGGFEGTNVFRNAWDKNTGGAAPWLWWGKRVGRGAGRGRGANGPVRTEKFPAPPPARPPGSDQNEANECARDSSAQENWTTLEGTHNALEAPASPGCTLRIRVVGVSRGGGNRGVLRGAAKGGLKAPVGRGSNVGGVTYVGQELLDRLELRLELGHVIGVNGDEARGFVDGGRGSFRGRVERFADGVNGRLEVVVGGRPRREFRRYGGGGGGGEGLPREGGEARTDHQCGVLGRRGVEGRGILWFLLVRCWSTMRDRKGGNR